MPDRTPLQYRLVHLRPLSFTERAGWLPDDADPELTYGPSFSFSLDEETRRVQIVTSIVVLGDTSLGDASDDKALSNDEPLAQCEVGCSFEFESLEPVRVDGRTLIPRGLLAQLLGIAISSARGVLVARAAHVAFQRAPLPVVSPLAMLNDLLADAGLDWVDAAETPSGE